MICGVAFSVFMLDVDHHRYTARLGDDVAEGIDAGLMLLRSVYMVVRLALLLRGHGSTFVETRAGGSSYVDFDSVDDSGSIFDVGAGFVGGSGDENPGLDSWNPGGL